MKIAIKFDDDEYMILASALYKIGVNIPLSSTEVDKYPIYYRIRKNPPAVYVNIKNKNLIKDILQYIVDIITYSVDEDFFCEDCKNTFGWYFETKKIVINLDCKKHNKKKNKQKVSV